MDTKRYLLCELGEKMILLGKQGESGALRIEFDCAPWIEEYPTATIKLFVFNKAHRQDDPILPVLGSEGTLRVWIVGEDETTTSGHGVIELVLQDADTGTTLKSATGYTTVVKSPSAGIEAREAQAGYVRYDLDQSEILTEEQKAIARNNIGAGTGSGTGGGIAVETDPTVPSWAKQAKKPTYTAAEVGALPSTYTPPNQTAAQVGADPAGTAASAIGAHNVQDDAHEDIRQLIVGLTTRLNALANSDDTTLDQMAEVVAYIKNNKSLIDGITTGKISTSDIVDNLTTNVSTKVLSAAQGVALKALIDAIVVPTSLPNPQPLNINGQTYDGSKAVTMTIQATEGGSDVAIDTTLTQSGQAADAAVVGEKLNELNEAIDAQGETLTQLNEKNAQQDEAIGKKLDTDKLPAAINTALAQAKESGEFDGKDGAPGAPGEPGYTPQKGIDYFDGAPGEPGTPGQAATFTITGAESLPYGSAPTVTEEAGSTAQARKYKLGIPEGKPGANGEGGGTGSEAVDLLMQVTTEERVAPIMVEFEPKKYRKIVAIARACGHTDNSTSGFLQILGLRESTGKYIKFASPSKLAQETTPHYQRWNVDLVGQLAACAASKSQNGGESWASDNSNGIKPLQVHRISTNELTGIALTAGGGSSYGDREAGSAQTFEVGAYVEVWGVRA